MYNIILIKAINSAKNDICKAIKNRVDIKDFINQIQSVEIIMSEIDFTELNNHNFSKIYTPASKFMFYKTRVLAEFNKEKAKTKLFDIKPKTFNKYWNN